MTSVPASTACDGMRAGSNASRNALSLAIAFAIASGVTPEAGLITAVVAGFIISALGGSRVQIGGPTGAFVVIVYGIVQNYGMEGIHIATLMAGVILICFGLGKLGSYRHGKVCLYVRSLAEVDLKVLEQLLMASKRAMDQLYPA